MSPVPRTAQTQPGQAVGTESKGDDANVLARAEPGEVHPLCGDVPLTRPKLTSAQ